MLIYVTVRYREKVTTPNTANNTSENETRTRDHPRVRLGRTDLEVSPVGAGTWQWGGRLYWGYGRQYSDDDLAATYAASIENGVNWFDTAELYGFGRSERLLGQFINSPSANGVSPNSSSGSSTHAAQKPLVVTKFFPFPWRLHRSSFRRALKASLRRVNTDSIDLYQIHFPYRPRGYGYWVDALADVVQDGLVKAVGVSNFSAEQTRRAHEALAKRGVVLASNQIGYSLLNRRVESGGVLDACRDLDVSVISFGPLGEGLLTGKYGPGSPPPLLRRLRWASKRLGAIPPIIGLMKDIATAHGATPSQVALNWLISKGTLPIPGVKSAKQAADNAAAMKWKLEADEFEALNRATERFL